MKWSQIPGRFQIIGCLERRGKVFNQPKNYRHKDDEWEPSKELFSDVTREDLEAMNGIGRKIAFHVETWLGRTSKPWWKYHDEAGSSRVDWAINYLERRGYNVVKE